MAVRRSIEAFTDLATEIATKWRERDHDERVFAELATEVLSSRHLHEEVTADDLLQWVLATPRLPPQLDPESKFGQPPLTIVSEPRFVIDALFWLEGTTEIHQHGFSGAFQVLTGSSVHSRYEWEERERVSTEILIGDVRFRGFELLGPGDTRTIGSGRGLIHGLFHLERPSVTIVVRTISDREAGPQYTYLKPHLAIFPFAKDVLLQRRLEALKTLKKLGGDHDLALRTQLAGADFITVFELARHYLNEGGKQDHLRELLEIARPRHGARIDVLYPVFDELIRVAAVVKKRDVMTSPEHRFFLAMLLNLPTRTAILDAVRTRHPDADPVTKVVGWIEDLADALGGVDTKSDHSSVVLTEMLRGHAGDHLLARLEEDFDIDDVRDDIRELERALRKAPTLRNVLTD